MIRKALRPDYYKPQNIGADGEDMLLGSHHIDHCVDSIRQTLMCNADITPLTWTWDDRRQKHFNRGTVLHTCKRFDKLLDWAGKHAAPAVPDDLVRVMNDPLDPDTWEEGYMP